MNTVNLIPVLYKYELSAYIWATTFKYAHLATRTKT